MSGASNGGKELPRCAVCGGDRAGGLRGCSCGDGGTWTAEFAHPQMRWQLSHKFDPVTAAIADRHYNRRKVGS